MDNIENEEWITSDIECKKEFIPADVDFASLDGCESQEFVECSGMTVNQEMDESQEHTNSAYPEDPKAVWYEAPTKLLLSLVDELIPNVGKSVQLNTKKKMWQYIHQQFLEAGYLFTGQQIEHKYRGIERMHKKKNKSSVTRMAKKNTFENEIDTIIKKKRCIELEKKKLSADARDNIEELVEGVKQGKFRNTELLDELRKMRKEKSVFYASVIRLMEQREKRDELKLELMRQILEKK